MSYNKTGFRPVEILLIEDSPSDADLTIEIFSRSTIAHNLTWLEDGETAMEYLHQISTHANAVIPDLILLDLNLPGMDGREILAALKADPKLKLIPVVVLTTSSAEEDIRKSYSLNANCYITKPIDIEQFIYIIQLIQDFWLTAVRLPVKH